MHTLNMRTRPACTSHSFSAHRRSLHGGCFYTPSPPVGRAGATGGRFSLRFGAGEAGLGTCFLCAVGAAGIEDSSAGGVYLHGIAAAGKDTSGGEVGQISGDGGGAGSGGFVAGSESGMSFDPAMRALESGWCPGAQT